MDDKEFVQRIKELLRVMAIDSADRAYREAAIIGAGMQLAYHFGNAEEIQKAGLAKQLEFLLEKSSFSPSVRNKLALEWMCLKLPYARPTAELAEIVFKIDHFAPYPSTAS